MLMGLSVAAWSRDGLTPVQGFACAVASLATDAFFVPLALRLGRDAHRPLWIPRASDWRGARARYPTLTALSWDLPYSFVGASCIVALLWGWVSAAVAIAYALHVAVDYPTHHGEWAVRPFYPFSKRAFSGSSSAWEWPLRKMAIAWGLLALAVVGSVYLRPQLEAFYNR